MINTMLTLGPRSENMQVEATGCLGKFCKLVFSRSVYNVIEGPVLMNHHFSMSFGVDELCLIQHLPMGFKFYPHNIGEHHFLLETDLKLMAFM